MPLKLPNPISAAITQAKLINNNRDAHLRWALERQLIEAPHLEEGQLLQGIEAFHKQRMEAIPPHQQYPEAKPWIQNIFSYQAQLQQRANLTDAQLAIVCSFGDYLQFRGIRLGMKNQQQAVEKCRVAFIPDTDRGRLHVKNVDDPPTYFKRRPVPAAMPFDGNSLAWDGTGSGLHIDDEPAEIFPLDVRAMLLAQSVHDVPDAVAFLSRYGKFWSSANCVLHDAKQRSVSIEKCTRNHMHVHQPGPDGRSWCSGMVCRDKDSDIAKYQTARRLEYRQLFNLNEDGLDCAFWSRCETAENKLATLLKELPAPADAKAIIAYFCKPTSQGGLNKDGIKHHPDQQHTEYTLLTNAMFLDEQKFLRWQRDETNDFKYPNEPEVYQF